MDALNTYFCPSNTTFYEQKVERQRSGDGCENHPRSWTRCGAAWIKFADEHLAFGSNFDGVKHLIAQRDSEAGHICSGTQRQHIFIDYLIRKCPQNLRKTFI